MQLTHCNTNYFTTNYVFTLLFYISGFASGTMVKNPPASSGDMGLLPGSGRSAGGGNGNSLQYSCLGNPMDWGAWQATVHAVAKSWTRLSPHTHVLDLGN